MTLQYVKDKLEELKTSQWQDYLNCSEVINAIDTVLELLKKEEEENPLEKDATGIKDILAYKPFGENTVREMINNGNEQIKQNERKINNDS
jgi:hypothetical protein